MTFPSHDDVVIDQFTRQAVPFARAPAHQEGIGLIRSLARITQADTVLDVACGPGLVACAVAPFAQRVTGLDLTPEMIAEARRAQAAQGLTNVDWQVGTAVPLPFEEAAFSVVLTRYSLHHFADPGAALAEMFRVCRPGGRVVVADLCIPSPQGARFDTVEQLRDPSHVHVLTPEELRGLFLGAHAEDLDEADYGLEIALEGQLERSFPVPGSVDRIRHVYEANIALDSLGIRPRRVDGQIWSTWPVRVIAGSKQG